MVCLHSFFFCWKPLLKFGEPILKEKHFHASENHFPWFSSKKNQFFRIAKTFFNECFIPSSETDFLASRNHFLNIFLKRLLPEKAFFLSSGNLVLNEAFIVAIGEGFFPIMETVTLIESFFLQVETVTVISGNQFLKTEFTLAGGNWFSG